MKRYKQINCVSTRHRFGLAFYSECEVTIFSPLPRMVTWLVALYMTGRVAHCRQGKPWVTGFLSHRTQLGRLALKP